MNYLLDTHIFVWMILEPQQLKSNLLAILQNPKNNLFLSIASVWEMQIKEGTGKLNLPTSVQTFVTTYRSFNGIQSLSIREDHIWTLATLPLHHRDPFDRLLIAQAIQEDLILISVDSSFASYPVKLMQ